MKKNYKNDKEINFILIVLIILATLSIGSKLFDFYQINIMNKIATDIHEHQFNQYLNLEIINAVTGGVLLFLFLLIAYYAINKISKYIFKYEHLDSVLSVIRDINKLIVREKNQQILIQESCNILISNHVYDNARIILLKEDNTIEYFATTNDSENMLEFQKKINTGWIPHCIEKTAIADQVYSIIENTEQNCHECPLINTFNNQYAFNIRLEYKEKIYGYLTLAVDQKYNSDEEELSLLNEVSGDIAYALYNLSIEQNVKEQAQRINALKELYVNIIDSIDNIIFVKDINFTYMVCNEAFEKLVGKSRDQIVGKSDYDIFEKSAADFFRSYDEKMIAQKKVTSNFEWVTYPNGEMVYLFTVKSPLVDSAGNIIGLVGNSANLTEQKNLEDALKKSQKRFEIAERIGKVGSWEVTLDMEQFWGSKESKHIYGLPEESNFFTIEMIETCIPERERVHQALVDLVEKGLEYNLEFEMHPYDGSPPKVISSIATVELDENGHPEKVIGVIQDITEESALETENRKFINVLDQSINEVHIFNLDDFHFSYVNKATLTALGYTLEEIKELTPLDIARRVQSIDELKQILKPLIDGVAKEFFVETEHKRKDGTVYPVETQLKIVEIDNVKQAIAISIDITEKIKSRDELKQSQENYKLLAENALDLIWKMNMELEFTYVNPSVEPILGYRIEEFVGSKLYEHCSQEEFAKMQTLASKMISANTDEGVTLEALMYKKDGSEIVLELNGKIIFDNTHTPIGFQGSARDFTAQSEARRKLKDALAELEKKSKELQTILQEAPNPIMLHNENGEVLMINKVWENLTGYDYEEINTIDKWKEKACGNKNSLLKENSEKLYSLECKTDLGESSITTKDGNTIIWQFSSAPLGIINGKRTVITSAMDITELKKKDELMMSQSRHAAMGEMIGMIAHQWRQPIAGIAMDANNMLLDIAFETFDSTAAEGYAQDILDQTKHLSKTIDDFRNFFKPDKSVSAVKLADIMDETLAIVKESLANNAIDVKTFYRSESQADAYPRELMQVFVNIINNARDALTSNHTENALIEINIYDDEAYVNTEICDNGGGIDNAIIPKLFDPYFSTKDEKTGTGLGLYMSKMIIEEHLNGSIEASNNKNGACFKVRLLKKNDHISDIEATI